MAIRYYIDQIEGLFQPIESTYTIHDVVKVGDDVCLVLCNTNNQTEVLIKVEDMYFNTWYSCPYGYYMKYVQAIGCDEPLENLHSISVEEEGLMLVETNESLMVCTDDDDKDYDYGGYEALVIHVKQISFVVKGDDGVRLYNFPWLDIIWNKVKSQFILVSRCLEGKMIVDIIQTIKIMCLMIEGQYILL